jgi:type IV secretion system protein TrbL
METMIDRVFEGFMVTIATGQGLVAHYGLALLAIFGLYAYFFRFAPYVMASGAGLGDALAGFLMMMLSLGITQWIMLELIPMTDALLTAAMTIGAEAGGAGALSPESLHTPSFVLGLHREATRPMEEFIVRQSGSVASLIMASPTVAVVWLTQLATYCIFLGIAVNMALILLEFHLAVLTASILLPCLVFTPTTFLGEWVGGWVLGGMTRILLLVIVMGIGAPLFQFMFGTPLIPAAADPGIMDAIGLVAGVALFGILAWQIPKQAAHLVGHGLGLSGSMVAGAAAQAMGVTRLAQAAMQGTAQMLNRATSPLLRRA